MKPVLYSHDIYAVFTDKVLSKDEDSTRTVFFWKEKLRDVWLANLIDQFHRVEHTVIPNIIFLLDESGTLKLRVAIFRIPFYTARIYELGEIPHNPKIYRVNKQREIIPQIAVASDDESIIQGYIAATYHGAEYLPELKDIEHIKFSDDDTIIIPNTKEG